MSRRIHQPVAVQTRTDGAPLAFNWRGVLYRCRVLSRWKLATRWWDEGREADRTYFRVTTSDCQVFELYVDTAHRPPLWMLDVVQD